MARGGALRKIGIGVAAVVAAVVVVLYTTSFGKGVRDVAGSGAVQDALAPHEDRTLGAQTSDENLKALWTGMKSYQASEGQYPAAATWMDDLSPRLVQNDLPKQEAEKKFVRPGVPEGGFGYALNDAAAGKYVGDLPKGTVLIFESGSTARNAHGDPKKDAIPGAHAVTVEGKPTKL